MFPLHRGNEMCFQISFNPHQKPGVSEDLINDYAFRDDYAVLKNSEKQMGSNMFVTSNRRSEGSNQVPWKKAMHKERERKRRQEMGALYGSLRSLLPLEYVKGKRAICDHMNQTVNYIEHLKRRIKELQGQRDELKKFYVLNSVGCESVGSKTSSIFKIKTFDSGVQIMIITDISAFPLSRVLEVLIQEGLAVVRCSSTTVINKVLHTILLEVGDLKNVDLSEVQLKILTAIPSLKYASD